MNSVRSTGLLTYLLSRIIYIFGMGWGFNPRPNEALEDLTVLTFLTVLMVVFQKFCIAIHKNSPVNQLPPHLPPWVFDLRLRPEGRDLRLALLHISLRSISPVGRGNNNLPH
jgi:hypothetical protein